MDDRKNLPEHETLTWCNCATTLEPKSKFTEKKLLYRQTCHLSLYPDFGIGVNKNSPNQAAALKFIAWLGTADFAQLLTNTLTGYFPLADHPVKINAPWARR